MEINSKNIDKGTERGLRFRNAELYRPDNIIKVEKFSQKIVTPTGKEKIKNYETRFYKCGVKKTRLV